MGSTDQVLTTTVTTSLGDTVTYDRYGEGRPVVFVAGAGPYRAIDEVTTATAQALADRGFTTVVHDRVGRGDSRQGPGPDVVHLDRELAAVAALVETVGPAVLVGHSSGCSIALAAAAEGIPVTGLVLWEAPLEQNSDHAAVLAWVQEVERLVVAGELEAAMMHYMKDMPAEFRDRVRGFGGFGQMVAQSGAYAADGESLAWAASAPLPDLLGGIDVPVLAVVGAQTFPGMTESAQAIAAAVPAGRWEEVAGAWHSWDVAAMVDRLATFAAPSPTPTR